MTNNPDNIYFSIIIPAFNEERVLPDCILAAKAQAGNFNKEIIVVDNNSIDNTSAVAKSLGVKVIFEAKKGVSQARKIGTEEAKGKFIVQIDADSRLPKNYLKEVDRRFKKDKKLVCLGGQMYFYDGVWWQIFFRPFVHYFFWIFTFIISLGKIGPMGNNMVFKKEVYNKTNGFDPDLKLGEDVDLSKKLSRFGKIRLDMSLKSYVSARRFKWNKDLWIYFLNFMFIYILGHPYQPELKEPDKNVYS